MEKLENMDGIGDSEVKLGKCPACGVELSEGDIDDEEFRGSIKKHFTYRCRKCDTIIGFSSMAVIS